MYNLGRKYSVNWDRGGYQRHPSGLEYIAVQADAQDSYHLETIFRDESYHGNVISAPIPFLPYLPASRESHAYMPKSSSYNIFTPHLEYHFQPDHFLKPGKQGIFVGKAEEIREFVEEAFEKIFHLSFPGDVKLSICSAQEFRKIAPSLNTVGVSFNRKKYGLLSEIFILNDSVGRVMLTIGHELGHVLTSTLENSHDEEAKAFAFSLAWMKIIQEHNIANLHDAIILEQPAHNGLHNVAFSFVLLQQQEKEVWEIYLKLIRKEISVSS